MRNIQKILLTAMLLIGLTISLSADEIVGHWIYDRKVSVAKAKSEDEKWFLKDAKAKDAIFDKNGDFRSGKKIAGTWKKTGQSNYERTVPNEPITKLKIEKDHLIMIMDLGDFGIINAYYKKK